LSILLYPSDEFGAQELPSADVAGFVASQSLPVDGGGCTLMQKVKVNGPVADKAWQVAKAAFPGDIGWNFEGIFIFDRAGVPVARYTSRQLLEIDAKLSELVSVAPDEL
jgi:glutathione peroxidase-family protein